MYRESVMQSRVGGFGFQMDSLYFEGTWFVSFGRVVSHIYSDWDIHEEVALFVLGASYKTAVVEWGGGGGLQILYLEQVSTVVNPFFHVRL
jgi:hypothetical protein